jgi:hypothetical protein
MRETSQERVRERDRRLTKERNDKPQARAAHDQYVRGEEPEPRGADDAAGTRTSSLSMAGDC